MEDPLDHLHNFDMLCGTKKINVNSEEAFKLRLSFSLGDKAHLWEKNFHKVLTTWDDYKGDFLTNSSLPQELLDSEMRSRVSNRRILRVW